MTAGRRYSDAERDEILRRAIAAQEGSDDITHEELVDAAREIGIDPAKVEAAAAEISRERGRRAEESEDDALVRTEVSRRRGRFGRHLLTYLIVNGALVAMNLLAGGAFWAIWPILGWGLGLALQAARALPGPSDEDREQILRRLSRRRARRARRPSARARRRCARPVRSSRRPSSRASPSCCAPSAAASARQRTRLRRSRVEARRARASRSKTPRSASPSTTASDAASASGADRDGLEERRKPAVSAAP